MLVSPWPTVGFNMCADIDDDHSHSQDFLPGRGVQCVPEQDMLVLAAAHAKPDCSAVHRHNHSSGFAMFRSDIVHLVLAAADPT